MRYIDTSGLRPTIEWTSKARIAYDAIKDLPPCERKDTLAKKASTSIWGDLKQELANLSNQKCWYCESRQIRSDKSVDHFRPKNAVEGCPGHKGYWWLAFDYRNYRYSCTYCNSQRTDEQTGSVGGKGTSFPLIDPSLRLYGPAALDIEEPMLLDPTVPSDPMLITFDSEGAAGPRFAKGESAVRFQRAKTSIKTYHLNHADLKEQRMYRFNRIRSHVQDGDKYLRNYDHSDDARHGFRRAIEELWALINRDAEYSAAAIAELRLYRDRYWVDDLLTRA